MKKGFASDNNAGILKEILIAIENANSGHTVGYGNDPYTREAVNLFRKEFGHDTEVFFVFNGTGANVLGLSSVTNSHNSIICAETAHIQEDECGAPEKFTGCKLLPVKPVNGKLIPEKIMPCLKCFDFEHHSQPGVISISQATELGTVYKPGEIKELADLAHRHNMLLHMDGARIANAAVSLNMPFKSFTRDCGVDVVSFGGTKNGMMMGEAVLFFNPENAVRTKYIRKQSMQLYSKMRFVGAQFIAYLKDDLWKKPAAHANNMAKILEQELSMIPGIILTQKVEANGVFAIVPPEVIEPLRESYFFYTWNEKRSEIRLMASFDTTEDEIHDFAGLLKELIRKNAPV